MQILVVNGDIATKNAFKARMTSSEYQCLSVEEAQKLAPEQIGDSQMIVCANGNPHEASELIPVLVAKGITAPVLVIAPETWHEAFKKKGCTHVSNPPQTLTHWNVFFESNKTFLKPLKQLKPGDCSRSPERKEKSPVFRSGHFAFDTITQNAWLAGKPLPLTAEETYILSTLVRAEGKIIEPENSASFGVLVLRIRRKFDAGLEDLPGKIKGKDYIKNKKGSGYYLCRFAVEPETLFAGTSAELQASGQQVLPAIVRTGGLAINTSTHEVEFNGQKLKLQKRQITLLQLLSRNPGEVVSYKQFPSDMSSANIASQLYHIREKLLDCDKHNKYIEVVYDKGAILKMLPVTPECRNSFGGQDAGIEAYYDAQESRRWAGRFAEEVAQAKLQQPKPQHDRQRSGMARLAIYNKLDKKDFLPSR